MIMGKGGGAGGAKRTNQADLQMTYRRNREAPVKTVEVLVFRGGVEGRGAQNQRAQVGTGCRNCRKPCLAQA